MYAAPKKRTAAGVIGILVALLAGGALVVAAINLATADEVVRPDDVLPYWIRAELFDAALFRVLVFAGIAGFFALVGVVLGAVARRGAAGKVAIVLAALVLSGSAYAQVRSFTHDAIEQDPAAPKEQPQAAEEADGLKSHVDTALPDVSFGKKHASFLLGKKLALATLGRARGADKLAIDRMQGEVSKLATELGALLPPAPAVTGQRASDTADALHYLLDTAGRPVWRHLDSKHGPQHGAVFELGIKLQLLRLLHADGEMAKGLVESIDRLAKKGGVSNAVKDLAAIGEDTPEREVFLKIDVAESLIDGALRG
jgi:hypothetical protein